MVGVVLIVLVVVAAVLPLFLAYCRRQGISGVRRIVPRALVVYAGAAGTLAAVITVSEWTKFALEGLRVWATIAGIGMLMFAPVFALTVGFAVWHLSRTRTPEPD